ncbi:hypothetical protein QE152_g19131 [Popillia japonica]|uniref:Endonuclease-reverse transcriptase n=1 Tax=Popillia japonica TaxID=7064 RepID=A0AAW1L4M1_POPJA
MKTEMGDMKNAIKEVSTDQKEFRREFQLLKLENETLKSKYENIAKENENLKKEMKDIQKSVEALEKEKRENNVIITGLKVEMKELPNIRKVMEDFVERNLGIQVQIKTVRKLGEEMCLITLNNTADKERIIRNKQKLRNMKPTRSRRYQTIKEMEVLHIKVLGLSEIRWPGQGERLNSNGSLLCYTPGGTRTKTGLMEWVFYWIKNVMLPKRAKQCWKKKQYDIQKLQEEDTLRKWNKQLQKFSVTKQQQDGDNIDGKWVQIKEIIHGTARKVIGYREQERKKWISEDTWNMIKKRKELKAKLNGMDGNSVNYEDIRKEYRELNKGIKKRARKDKRIWADNLARRAEEAAASHNTREVYIKS